MRGSGPGTMIGCFFGFTSLQGVDVIRVGAPSAHHHQHGYGEEQKGCQT